MILVATNCTLYSEVLYEVLVLISGYRSKQLFLNIFFSPNFVLVFTEGFFKISAADFDLTVVVDRPFIFTVRDMVNNIPILVGRVTNPATTV